MTGKEHNLNHSRWKRQEELDPYYSRHDQPNTATDFNRNFNPIGVSLGICIGVIVDLVFITAVKSCDKEPQPATVKEIVDCRDCRNCHVGVAKTYKELKQLQRMNARYDKVMGVK